MPEMRVEGLADLMNSFNQAGSETNKSGRQYLQGLAAYGVKQVQLYTENADAVDTGELLQGIHYTIETSGKTIIATILPSAKADQYAAPMEYGSKPHWPPIAALQGWADRHGIPAFLVARKIALEGTEPRWMWRDAFADVQARVDTELQKFADALARRF